MSLYLDLAQNGQNQRAREAAHDIQIDWHKAFVLALITKQIVLENHDLLCDTWNKSLHWFASRPRSVMLREFGHLTVIAQHPGGSTAKEEAITAMSDVCRWWL